MAIVYIGLGSNLSDPEQQVRTAITELGNMVQTSCLATSSLYQSEPLLAANTEQMPGAEGQPDYINAVAKLETRLKPLDLLHECQALENQHQRIRAEHWGPRTLDLDILLYDDCRIESPELTVPHPGLYERNFVLYPLAEIDADMDIPGAGLLSELLSHCELGSLEKLTE